MRGWRKLGGCVLTRDYVERGTEPTSHVSYILVQPRIDLPTPFSLFLECSPLLLRCCAEKSLTSVQSLAYENLRRFVCIPRSCIFCCRGGLLLYPPAVRICRKRFSGFRCEVGVCLKFAAPPAARNTYTFAYTAATAVHALATRVSLPTISASS